MPIVVEFFAPEFFLLRRRSAPQIVIHRGRNFAGFGRLADGVAAVVTKRTCEFDLAEIARTQPRDGFLDGEAGARLSSRLDDAIVFARGFHKLATFPEVVRNRLLDIDILARLNRPDATERMPVIRRGERDCINIFVLQKFSHVLIRLRSDVVFLFEISSGAIQHSGVHIADGHDANAFPAEAVEMVLTATVHADDSDADVAVRADDLGVGVGGLCAGERGREAQ